MIDTEKTRLMTKLAIYEKHEGREDISMARYYKSDYVRLQILKTILAVTLGYVVVLAMIAIYYSEFLLDNALILRYDLLGTKVLGYYLVILISCIALVTVGETVRYASSRKRLSKYYKALSKVRKLTEEQERRREMEEEEWEDAIV